MSRMSARQALEYATHYELLKLYGLLALSWVLTLLGSFASPRGIVSMLAYLALLLGIVAFLVGVVAIAHKVIAESRQ